ncbi:MAG: cytochrome b/b6 domain-containing protein [Deltaproteobacteria bacterium]|nr:cytochrome b/b6 domain-containing protein [Deltaproteobacteria bacterium]
MKDNEREFMLVSVWDWQTRVLHWTNAILIMTLALLALSAEGMEWPGVEREVRRQIKEIHAYMGYILVFTLTVRIIWGFIGNEYARWIDIIPHKKERWQAIWGNIKWYLRGFKGSLPLSIGHNPLASLFYIALFIVLLGQVLTGLALAGVEFGMFPGSLLTVGFDEELIEEVAEDVHEFGLWFILFFIVAHLTGLVVHEIGEKAGLLSSMIHGRKYIPKERL